MLAVNKSILAGELSRPPRYQTVKGGRSVCEGTVVVEEQIVRDGEIVITKNFVDFVVWQSLAEKCRRLVPGDPIVLSGKLISDSYYSEQQSRKIYRLRLSAESVEVLVRPVAIPSVESAEKEAKSATNANTKKRSTPKTKKQLPNDSCFLKRQK